MRYVYIIADLGVLNYIIFSEFLTHFKIDVAH